MKTRKIVSVLVTLSMAWGAFLGLLTQIPMTEAHISDDSGNPLQLFSYFTSSPITINGDITDNGGGHGKNCDKWKDAYVRTITMKQEGGNTELDATIMLMNDDTNLYVGVVYVGNAGNANEVRLYFDEGNGTAPAADGPHDDALTDPGSQRNENAVYFTAGSTKTDSAWNASSQDWEADGDGEKDFTAGVSRQGGINNFEFKIPLDNAKSDDATNSDLDVSSSDELGFYIRIYQVPNNNWFYWKLTNGAYKGKANPCTDSPGWADFKLGASKTRATIYATYSKSAPTVDGDITSDFNWADCWERAFKLTNETGNTIDGVLKAQEDFASHRVYLGFVIYDQNFSSQDELRIYLDQNYTGKKQQDYILTDNYEDCAIIGYTGGYTDSYADHQLSGGNGYVKWTSGDTAASDATDGAAGAKYYVSPTRHYEFEYRWDRWPTTDLYDANTSDYGSAGVMIRYNEGETGSVYYWLDIGNDDDVIADDTGANSLDLALGWGILQTGCPKMKLVTPQDGGMVKSSDYTFRVDAAAPGGTGSNISFVGFRVEGRISWSSLSYSSGDVFTISWDTTQYANGKYNIEILAKSDSDHGAVVARRFITVTVANPTSSAPPSGVNITSPAIGPLTNITAMTAVANAADRVEIYVDGIYVNDMIPGSSGTYTYDLNTKNYIDGNHTLKARAVNGAGETSVYRNYEFDNWDPLTSVAFVHPKSGDTINGIFNVQVDFEQDSKDFPRPGFAELFVDGSATALEYREVDLSGTGDWGYNIFLNTVWFADGPHTLKAVVHDPEGNTMTDLILVNLLNKPAVQVIAPAGNEVMAGTYNLTIKVSDPNGDPIPDTNDNPVYRVDGGAWYDMTNSLNLTNIVLSEVGYNLSNCATAEWAELFNPTSTALDLSGWKLVEEGGTWCTFGSISIPAFGVVTITSNASSFRSVFGRDATCSAGLSAQALGDTGDSLTLKNAAGTAVDYVEWDTPGSSAWNPRPSASSNRSIQRNPYVDTDSGRDWLSQVTSVTPGVAAPVAYAASLDTTLLSDGPHTITFQATDSTGAVATSSVSINVDNIVLQSVNISSPTAGMTIRNEITVVAYPYPASQAAYAELYIDNEFAGFDRSLNATGAFEIKLLTTGFEDGPHNLKVIVYDEYGSAAINVTSVTVLNRPNVYIVQPQENSVLRGNVKMEIAASDLDGILDNATLPHYRIDGGSTWYPMSYNSTIGRFESDGDGLNTSALLDGPHTVEFEIIDSGTFNLATIVKVRVIVDNTRPSVFVVSPSHNQTIEGKFTFQVSANDNLDMDRVELVFENLSGGSTLKELASRRATYNSFTGYFEYTVDTSVFSDGQVNITVAAHDRAGNQNATTIGLSFFVDNTPPLLVIYSPMPGQYVEGTVNISVNISDDPYVPEAKWRVDGGPWQALSLSGGNLTFAWDTANLTDGQHIVTIRAMDRMHHVTEVELQVVVDNHAPFAGLVAPLPDQFVEGVLTFRAGASDALGIANVTLNFSGINYTMSYNGNSRQYEYSVNTLGLPDGTYNASVTVIDLSGKETVIGPVEFCIDNNRPTLAVNAPAEGGFVEGNYTINITSEDAFPFRAVYRIGAMEWVELTRSGPYWTAPWNTKQVADGTRTLTIRVTDRALHVVEQTLTVIVDNTLPNCAIVAPMANQYVENTFTFTVLATDAVGVADVRLTIFGTDVQASYSSTTGMYEYPLDTLVWTEDNIRNVSAVVTDRSGKIARDGPVNFRVDNHAPVLTVLSPQSGDYVDGVMNISVDVTDAFPGPTEYNVDGAGWVTTALPWNTTRLVDGPHRLSLRARDLAGHSTQQDLTVIADNHDPTCVVSAPLQQQFIAGSYRFQVAASDVNGISQVRMSVFNLTAGLPYNAQSGYYEYTIDTFRVPDGVYEVATYTLDASGRRTDAANVTFMVDNEPPAITVLSPRNGDYLSGEVNLSVTVQDTFPGSVMYTVDDAGWMPVERPFNSTLISDGEHSLAIRASDQAGHAVVHRLTVYVNNLAPLVTVLEPMDGAHLQGTTPVKVYAGGSVQKVLLAIDDGAFRQIYRPIEGSPYAYSLDTITLAEGNHTLRAKSVDFTGHESVMEVKVVVDNAGPAVLLKSPKGANSGLVSFAVNCTDVSGVGKVQVNIDGSGWRDLLLEPNGYYVYRWPTDSGQNGEHTYSFALTDGLGNTAVVTGKFTVTNAPDYWKMLLDALPLLAFLFLMIMVIAMMAMVRYGRLQAWIRQDVPKGPGLFRLKKGKGGKEATKNEVDGKPTPENAGKPEEADEKAGEEKDEGPKETAGEDKGAGQTEKRQRGEEREERAGGKEEENAEGIAPDELSSGRLAEKHSEGIMSSVEGLQLEDDLRKPSGGGRGSKPLMKEVEEDLDRLGEK